MNSRQLTVRCVRRPARQERTLRPAGYGPPRNRGASASAIRAGLPTSAAVRRINHVSLSRLQSYVDAILAIAATLLILNVTVTGGGSLSHSLVHAWPSYAAYAVSFLTIGVIWINHHAILRLIERPGSAVRDSEPHAVALSAGCSGSACSCGRAAIGSRRRCSRCLLRDLSDPDGGQLQRTLDLRVPRRPASAN